MLTDGPTEREAATIAEHFEYLQRLHATGVVLMAGRTLNNDAQAFGIVVFTAESEHVALRLMQADPAVCAGVMKAELFPYRVALWSPSGPPAKGGD